jgi:NitT/TauT family transport system permease protein
MTALAPLEARRPVEWPDFESELVDPAGLVVVERPLPWYERIVKNEAVQNGAILAGLALLWELYARFLDNPLLLPTFSEMVATFLRDISNGLLLNRITTSLKSLAYGYSAGLALAAIFTSVAVSTRLGSGLLTTLTAMFNPLPAIALLPLALIWFGLGNGSLVFVLIHSVLWPVALNTHAGFRAVSATQRMVGRNYGLNGLRYVFKILIPAAFGSILTGLKIGWAFAWRTLIAAELVFGVSSGQGGLGWFIFENKNLLDIPSVFAGLFAVIMIGLIVENVAFRTIELRTVRRWGMQT